MPSRVPALVLKPGREKSLRQRHPWIFSGAIERVVGKPAPGSTVDVRGHDQQWLGYAAYSPASQIRARVWTFDAAEAIDAEWFAQRIARAVAARSSLLDKRHNACRLIHAEADGLPGVIADRHQIRNR